MQQCCRMKGVGAVTGAEALVRCLECEGVEYIFGYPGAVICPVFDALYDSEIRVVLVRQEQNAAHEASGYTRISGKPAVAIATSGPGATNLMTGIATAYADSIPMVCITGQVEWKLMGTDGFQETDVSGAVESFVKTNNVKLVINCAAYTNVDKAESDEATALRINAEAVKHLAGAMARVDGRLIHFSTDYVFGGNRNNTPCTELETVNPTGAYGRTKLAGEQAAAHCKSLVFRTSWLYSEYGKNFCKTMLNLTETKPTLKVVFDQVGTPTYAGDLAQAVCTILEKGLDTGNEGLYHYSNEGVCSWYDFTKEIARQSGHKACDIFPCHSSEYPSPVVRPSYSVLDKTKFKQTFGLSVPYWTDSLSVCLEGLGVIVNKG